MRLLLVGSGGREHALASCIARSPLVTDLHAAPGNPGIGRSATLHAVAATDVEGLVALARSLGASLVVVGPEAPLVAGLVDRLADAGIPAFGPSAGAARIEGSKAFAKDVMAAAGVPTARYALCDTPRAARHAVRAAGGDVVVKADGLAAGKGVAVCGSVEEAERAVHACLVAGAFGEAGRRVLVEERLRGPELSLLALCDGSHVLPLWPARDYKRVGDGDTGPNTGGMGAISPPADADEALVEELVERVHRPVVRELARRGTPFRGCLYAGLLLTADGPRVLEFNARLGDPEAQAVLPRLGGDLVEALLAAASGELAGVRLQPSGRACAAVTVAAAGYPEAPRLGAPIEGIDAAEEVEGVTVFHAGTAIGGAGLEVAGGRVLNVTALGADLDDALERAYEAAGCIRFEGMQLRRDIGRELAVGGGARV